MLAQVMNLKEKQNNTPYSVMGKKMGVNIAFTIFLSSYYIWIFEKLHSSAIVALLSKVSVFDVPRLLYSC